MDQTTPQHDLTPFTIDLTRFASATSLSFRTSSVGLTGTQLNQFTASGHSSFALDSSGYLTAVTPEPGMWAHRGIDLTFCSTAGVPSILAMAGSTCGTGVRR